MTKGKYAARADTRLKVLESEALRNASAQIADLKAQLKAAKHDTDVLRAEINSRALQAAKTLSQREKQHLRNQIDSMRYEHDQARMRYAVLTWEVIHRGVFDMPSPKPIARDTQTWGLWLAVNWEIAALFLTYDEAWEFFKNVEGQEFRMAGGTIVVRSGDDVAPQKQTARQAHRMLHKSHKFRSALAHRFKGLQEYMDRIWSARNRSETVPVTYFGDGRSADADFSSVMVDDWRQWSE